ncbi:MAG: amidohydrolase [Gemmatimonadetes bacterium]|nr:amidohydrolase [Gemmatimonadota bacterium]
MIAPIQPALFERMVALRRDLHRDPEISWQERHTTYRIARELDRLEIAHASPLETGLVAEIEGPPGVPAIALRADIDALPIQEETGLDFASRVDGVMHACGHDAHAAMLLGAAELLVTGPDPIPAPVRLIFQPAEELGTGALAMIEAGALAGVDAIFGGHVDGHIPAGVIALAEGTVNASSDSFRITIRGRQGHAARPHETVDAVVVGSLIVMAVQTIVSREIDPAHPSVLSIGRFEAGNASNVIAGKAVLEGTIRAQEMEVRDHLQRSLERVCASVGQLHEAEIDFALEAGPPPLVNREPMLGIARAAAAAALDSEHVRRAVRGANMGGEDFSWYLREIPGCYARFGARPPGLPAQSAHSSSFLIDEEVLATGAAWMAEVARRAGRTLASHPEDPATIGGEL